MHNIATESHNYTKLDTQKKTNLKKTILNSSSTSQVVPDAEKPDSLVRLPIYTPKD